MLSLSTMTIGADPYPARMKASLPGVPDTGPHEYFSGFLNAGTPPSGRGTMCAAQVPHKACLHSDLPHARSYRQPARAMCLRYFHYICAMAPDWKNKPVSIWYNGGPGAPSTYGLFQEFGPFMLTDQSLLTDDYHKTGIPTPIYNPWTWANVTSLCEIDSPAPMGARCAQTGERGGAQQGRMRRTALGADASNCGRIPRVCAHRPDTHCVSRAASAPRATAPLGRRAGPAATPIRAGRGETRRRLRPTTRRTSPSLTRRSRSSRRARTRSRSWVSRLHRTGAGEGRRAR